MADSIAKRPNSRLDVVINNSGYAGPTIISFTGGTADDFHRCFQVNAFGVYHVARHLVPLLLKTERGAKSLVVVSGAAAWITEGPIANIGYCSSRLAQLRLVEMMARQYEKDGLLSVAVHPGAVPTETAMAAPKEFIPFLVDSKDLCGAFCVWLTRDSHSMMWLSGRYLNSKWDVDELLEKKAEIIDGDLLKAMLIPPRIECFVEERRPGALAPRDCQRFLARLATDARLEPVGAYKWYGRHLDPCRECVQLPTTVAYGFVCEARIDVDEEDDQELSIFGLKDLVRALQGVQTECLTRRKRAGRGFPDSQRAWARFIRNEHPRALGNETASFGGRMVG
ncbi:MAG: hypothetical protein Q9182_005831 [Xanthomendoza sp. 2 TL-2023]